jgi:hypothetical protein
MTRLALKSLARLHHRRNKPALYDTLDDLFYTPPRWAVVASGISLSFSGAFSDGWSF